MQDVASGLAHLHSHGLVSGELAGASVHMCAAPHDTERGFSAKLSSAVHAVCHEEAARASRGRDAPRLELLAHTAPEVLLEHEAPTPASDIYSLGVLLWEASRGAVLVLCARGGGVAGLPAVL